MLVSEAVAARRSIRQFTDAPVSDDVLRDLLERAARSPSGGNLQPWRIYVINDDVMARFRATIGDCDIEPPEYEI